MIVTQLKALQDNFIYILHIPETKTTAVIDPSTSKEVLDHLRKNNLKPDYILNTHHHWDHVGGNLEVKKATGCKIVGFDQDAERIPGIDIKLKEGESFSLGNVKAKVLFIPGHTLGHIAYYFESEKALFCGDTLFSLGCGRLFEGTAEQMYKSLNILKNLPDDTKVYCAHEYTLNNARFAAELYKNNSEFQQCLESVSARLKKDGTTVPSLLSYEKKYNPFLLAKNVEEFASYRSQKDNF